MKKNYIINDQKVSADVIKHENGVIEVEISDKKFQFKIQNSLSENDFVVTNVHTQNQESFIVCENYYFASGVEFKFTEENRTRGKKAQAPGSMLSPMPGKVLKIMVNPGDMVDVGTPLLVLEAMKMEHTIKASSKGMIEQIKYNVGDQVSGGVELVQIKG